jgi:hypothetical protein
LLLQISAQCAQQHQVSALLTPLEPNNYSHFIK